MRGNSHPVDQASPAQLLVGWRAQSPPNTPTKPTALELASTYLTPTTRLGLRIQSLYTYSKLVMTATSVDFDIELSMLSAGLRESLFLFRSCTSTQMDTLRLSDFQTLVLYRKRWCPTQRRPLVSCPAISRQPNLQWNRSSLLWVFAVFVARSARACTLQLVLGKPPKGRRPRCGPLCMDPWISVPFCRFLSSTIFWTPDYECCSLLATLRVEAASDSLSLHRRCYVSTVLGSPLFTHCSCQIVFFQSAMLGRCHAKWIGYAGTSCVLRTHVLSPVAIVADDSSLT